MIRYEDYILWQINLLMALIAKLFNRAQDKDDAQAQEVFDESLKVLDLDTDTIRSTDPKAVIDKLSDVRLLTLLNELLSIYLPVKPDDALSELKSAVVSRLGEKGYYQFDTGCSDLAK